ncbi:MAG: TadE/TadG family type IV pilus assembly protein [Terriglobales bacterium]
MLRVKRVMRKLGNTDGAEIAEAALVLPLVFMLLLGIVWFGRAYNIYSTIQQAAQQGAITAARSTCATCGDAQAAVGSVTACPSATPTVACAVAAVMQASNLDPTQIKLPPAPNCAVGLPCAACPQPPFPPGGGCPAPTSGNIYVCQNVQLNPVGSGVTQTQPTQCGSVVSFQYPFQFYFPGTSLNMSTVLMTAQAQSRMED